MHKISALERNRTMKGVCACVCRKRENQGVGYGSDKAQSTVMVSKWRPR